MKTLRQIHYYLGVLFAPSILFFALTGAYQTFRWQENGAAGALTPVLSQMASIHKNAALESGARKRPTPPATSPRSRTCEATCGSNRGSICQTNSRRRPKSRRR